MKAFFVVLLVVLILFPFYSFTTDLRDLAHNQWKTRRERLDDISRLDQGSAHLGLTAAELASLDDLSRSAYKEAVSDGYRLGHAYDRLSLRALGLDALLFAASVASLRHRRTRSI